MLDFTRTREVDSFNYEVANAISAIEEGAALIHLTEDGIGKVTPSDGSSDSSIFMGVALNYYNTITTAVKVETLTIPSASPYTVTLAKTPTADAAIGVKQGSTVYDLTEPPVATADFQADANVLTFNVADAGKTVVVTYRYTLTVEESLQLVGVGAAFTPKPAGVVLGSTGVIRRGEIYTTMFDTADDWGAANVADIKAGANGYFQRGGTGASVKGYVRWVPTADYPFLGLFIDL